MAEKKTGSRVLGLVLLVVVASGLVLGGAFYQEQIVSFFTQEAWNSQAPKDLVAQFIKLARQPTGGAGATALLDSAEYDTTLKGEALATINQGKGMARLQTPVASVIPSPDLKQASTDFLAKDGGSFRVIVQYANGKWGEYRVRKLQSGRKITGVPGILFTSAPTRNPADY
jgi:hypothetical protein